MDNATNNTIIKKVRIIFKKIAWKKILTFSFFVIIACILWFMQIYNQTFETEFTIPIQYTSIPDSIQFKDTLPKTIKIRVRDYGYNIIRYAIQKPQNVEINITTLLNHINSEKLLQGTLFESYIRKSLTQSVSVISYDPYQISFKYSKLHHRKIAAIFDGEVNLTPGYFLNGDIRIIPDSITAYGSKTELSKIMYAYTTNDTIDNLESNRKVTLKLIEHPGIKFSPETVNIYIPIEAYTQKKIQIPVECYNLPKELSIKFFPSKVDLSFFVGVSKTDSITAEDFSVGVDYNGIKNSKNISVPLRITKNPSYTKNMTISPPNVEYIFEHRINQEQQ